MGGEKNKNVSAYFCHFCLVAGRSERPLCASSPLCCHIILTDAFLFKEWCVCGGGGLLQICAFFMRSWSDVQGLVTIQ